MKVISSLMLYLLLSLFSFDAQATKIVGNGGDGFALEFANVATQVARYFELTGKLSVDIQLLKKAVAGTSIESTDQPLQLNGIPKDAINYPTEMRILFNRKRWAQLDDKERFSLVLHEYLGILGIDDSGYQISKQALAALKFDVSSITVESPTVVNFAHKNQYLLEARIRVESFGPTSQVYNAGEQSSRVIIEVPGQKKTFTLPIKGYIVSAQNSVGDVDAGIYIQVLQPVMTKRGEFENFEGDYSVYIKHAVKLYRIEFKNPRRGGMPTSAELSGPISNQAG